MKIPPELEKQILNTPGVVVSGRTTITELARDLGHHESLIGNIFWIPMKLPSLANARMHWHKLAGIKKLQRALVLNAIGSSPLPSLPRTITLTRIGKRKMDDDNLASAFKAVRDAVAEAYGVDDGSSRYRWVYKQEIGKEYAIEIQITEA